VFSYCSREGIHAEPRGGWAGGHPAPPHPFAAGHARAAAPHRYSISVRVCVDVLPLLVRSAGVKNYLYYWVRGLIGLAGAGRIRLFPPFSTLGPLDHERSVAGPLASGCGLASLALINYARLPLHDWMGGGCDIFHATNLLHVPPRKLLLTTTVHDVTSWVMPELHPAANRRADRGYESMLRAARGIIAVSGSTRDDVVRVLGIDPGKIEVIHSGVAESFFRAGAAEIETARASLGLSRPYVLFLGTVEPRKNIGTLLDAWQTLSPSLREEYELVLAGPSGWAAEEVRARLATPPAGVRHLGYVPESQLAGLTAGADLFVYPSLYEGFGFPVVQAMAAGTPVLTSNVSSLPEVVAGAGELVDPRSTTEIAAGISRLLLSPALRASRSASGRERASQFTWDRCAARSVEFFERVAAG
jgi:glycosyltransferase involved in cell wall biosynthesis